VLRNEWSRWSHLFDLLTLLYVFVITTIKDILIQRADVCPWYNPSSWKYRLFCFCYTRSKLILLVVSRIIVSYCFWVLLLHWVLLYALARRGLAYLNWIYSTEWLLSSTSYRIRSGLKGLAGWLRRWALCLNSIWMVFECCNFRGFLLIRLLKGKDWLLLALLVLLFIVQNLAVNILVLL
jgi:hypothetical protein